MYEWNFQLNSEWVIWFAFMIKLFCNIALFVFMFSVVFFCFLILFMFSLHRLQRLNGKPMTNVQTCILLITLIVLVKCIRHCIYILIINVFILCNWLLWFIVILFCKTVTKWVNFKQSNNTTKLHIFNIQLLFYYYWGYIIAENIAKLLVMIR